MEFFFIHINAKNTVHKLVFCRLVEETNTWSHIYDEYSLINYTHNVISLLSQMKIFYRLKCVNNNCNIALTR